MPSNRQRPDDVASVTVFLRHSRLIVALTLAVSASFLVCTNSIAAPKQEEAVTQQDDLDAVEESRQCKKDPASKACEDLRLAHYCRYSGSSYYAVRCAGGRRANIEVTLNATYRRVLSALRKLASEDTHRADVPRLLVEAQRAWVKFRDAECNLAAESFKGGTLQPALAEGCMADKAEQRIQALKILAQEYGVER